ncbi:MAG TPA: tetratricopeptide repeat protein [Tepidisphaeraceae bacterium]|nr:tetratricopeptide repeat protein [Tepidisphaeraceae bacterium]
MEDTLAGIRGWNRSFLKTSLTTLLTTVGACVGAAILLTGLTGCNDVFSRSFASQNSGMELYRAADYEKAAGAFTDATRQNPRDYKSFFMAGQCYEKMDLEQKAIASYKTGLSVMDTTDTGRKDDEYRNKFIEELSQTIATAQSRDTEISSLEATAHATNRSQDWLLLAKTYVATGDADSAIDAFNRASIQAPTDLKIAKTYGLYLEGLNQQKRAEPYLIRAYQLDPTDVEIVKALRRVGIVPGPSLLATGDLARPIVPKGPVPELQLFPNQTPANQASVGE